MDKLTCIYPVIVQASERSDPMLAQARFRPCGFTREDNDLVKLQEHLRDEHLQCSTEALQNMLRRTVRWITHPNGSVGMLVATDPWNDQEYTKIEWALPTGRKWLRAEAVNE